MRRHAVGLAVLAVSVLTLLVLTGAFAPVRTLADYRLDAVRWESLQQTRAPTDAPLLQTLTFQEHDLLLDPDTGCFYYSLIEDSPAARDPALSWRGVNGVRLAVRGEITTGEPLQLMAYTETEYRLYPLYCTTLPLLDISGPDPADLTGEDRTPAAMRFTLFDNRAGAAQRVVSVQGNIHVRGMTTASYPKKGYRIHLTETSPGNNLREADRALLGMRQDGDWLLYAAYNDPERIRNVFSSRLWWDSCAENNLFGVQNGMEYRYVELFFNNRYWGLYALGHPIDADQLALRTGLNGYQEFLFQKLVWTPSEIGIEAGQPFLYGYELHTADARETYAWQALVAYYVTLLYPPDAAALYGIADIGNAIDAYLFFNLVQGADNVDEGALKNLYIAFKEKDGRLLALYTPWDLDLTWGSCYSTTAPLNTALYGVPVSAAYVMDLNPVYHLQQEGDAAINALVRERYAALRAGAWSEQTLLATLDELEADIFASGAYARDALRWPDSLQTNGEAGLSAFKDYVLQRVSYMDAFVASLS